MKNQLFTPSVTPPEQQTVALWFVFRRDRLLVLEQDQDIRVPRWQTFSESGLPMIRQHFLGTWGKHPCYSVETVEQGNPPTGFNFISLRALTLELSHDLFTLAGRAIQILQWDRDHQFCGRCGHAMQALPTERAKRCPSCALVSYPRISPAVIMRITRGDEILLSRSAHFAPDMYSVQAGFVEAGETLEETVIREVQEEVGIQVDNLHYFGSQPWPFPHSLMIAFTADYVSGEITLDQDELEDAQWFQATARLPKLPSPMSIARHLIEDFLAEHR
ncbi:NAD(+) diphosphatase [Beggiatoa leptomitoformis]|uniref:NAD-capped RNA hydrolase NudC n=1 Tax=Beggiatoa leptomitoformis TaxID=288004 RepID=A0A2N9YBK8_9GAMM|nr:NAD(+) diphosphatase [Beggiatoa leptomitoformis]ALG66806.1 NAD(+) diphosphatase [Beggiatoa leptomitoformis]AUI67846.1 NAD(+) diphosphatase [Beggiatoa leptomitoformis]